MNDADQWEHLIPFRTTGQMARLGDDLNRLGAEGWEVVGYAAVDPTLGTNALSCVMKCRVVPPPAPPGPEAAWHPDPCGRFDKRYWDGHQWSAHVGVEKGKQLLIDSPTTLAPPKPR